jgi:hypothetical protein
MHNGKTANTNIKVFGLYRPWLKPTINHTRGKHAPQYTTDVAVMTIKKWKRWAYGFMVFNATLNNISAISWQSAL